MDKVIVKESNELARCSWKPKSIYEASIVALVASKIHKDDEDFKEYTISYNEISGPNPDGRTHRLIKEAAFNLLSKTVHTKKADGGWKGYTIFLYIEYFPKNSTIVAQFAPAMKEHYLNLQVFFTEYSLAEYLSLPSIYSQHIFKLLHSCKSEKEFTFTVDELHTMLQTPPSLRTNFKDFNNRVLKPALRHITQFTSLNYSYEPIKRGRKYHEIKFVFTRKKQALIAKKEEKKIKVKQKKVSQKNNDLVKRALECFEKNNNKCNKKLESEMCEFCRTNLQNKEIKNERF